MWHVGGREKVNSRCRCGDLMDDPGVDGRIILKWIFDQWDVEAWTGLL
jgi:hypothetical protein